jgi:spore coat protein U domain-containing protein, fimbrial subunit CupE1/2/3/6
MQRLRFLAIFAVAIAIGGVGSALAASPIEMDMNVSIQIDPECLLTELNDLTFPATTVITAPVTAQADLKLHCTTDTVFHIELDAGQGTSATTTTRYLGDTITYSLYTDGGHADVWGEGAEDVTGSGTGDEETFTIYGLIPLQTTPAPATYADIIRVTITY